MYLVHFSTKIYELMYWFKGLEKALDTC